MAGTLEKNPFPGLRPFEAGETHLFFGREGQSDELLRKLTRTRFVTVVGTSGSGKSSLVRAGLLPALYGGITSIGSRWRVAVMRPGSDPLGNLATELMACAEPTEDNGPGLQLGLLRAILMRSERGLVEGTQQVLRSATRRPENLLLVVDQFEELFRFREEPREPGTRDEAGRFIELLLAAKAQEEAGIFVVLTMRLDYLRDCAQFWGLPEAINEGQYLIPRMKRDELRAAITGPVGVGGGEISPQLVNQLLNEAGDSPSKLPILQHALMRTWDEWSAKRDGVIDVQHYAAVGGMTHALSRHADQIYEELSTEAQKKELPAEAQRIAKRLFQCLIGEDASGRLGRRPAKLGEICQVLGVGEGEVVPIIEEFRRDGRSFLTPPPRFPLLATTDIDISHESLITGWATMGKWTDEELASARIYRRLAETAALAEAGRVGLYRGRELKYTLEWQKTFAPTKAWAERYTSELGKATKFGHERPSFDKAIKFLEGSRAQRRLMRVFTVVAAAVFAGLLAIVYIRVRSDNGLRRSQELALTARSLQNYKPELSLQLAKQALDANPTDQGLALATLREALAARPVVASLRVERGRSRYGFRSAAFSPSDQSLLLTADEEGRVALSRWDAATGRTSTLTSFNQPGVTDAAFSADGSLVAIADNRGGIAVDVVGSLRERSNLLRAHQDTIHNIAFNHRSGRYFVTASSDGTARVWTTVAERVVPASEPMQHPDIVVDDKVVKNPVRYAAFSPSDGFIVTASWDHVIYVWSWDRNIGKIDLKFTLRGPQEGGHEDGVNSVAFDRTGKYIMTASNDTTARIWEWEETTGRIGRRVGVLRHRWPVLHASFSPDAASLSPSLTGGSYIVTAGGGGSASVWQWAPSPPRGSAATLAALAATPQIAAVAQTAASAEADLQQGAAETKVVHQLSGHTDWVVDASFSPKGTYVVTAGDDGKLLITETIRGQRKLQVNFEGHAGAVLSAATNEDGTRLVTGVGSKPGEEGNYAQVWDADKNRLAQLKGDGAVRSVGFGADGNVILTADESSARLWRTSTGWAGEARAVSEPFKPPAPINGAAISRDARLIAAACRDSSLWVWQAGTPGAGSAGVGHTAPVNTVVFNRFGTHIVSASDDGTARIWSVLTDGGLSVKSLLTLTGHSGPVRAAAISPDSRFVATAGSDSTVRVWDTLSGDEVLQIDNDEGASSPVVVYSVAFSPDGGYIVTADARNTWRVWEISSRKLLVRQVETALSLNPSDTTVGGSNSDRTILTYAMFSADGQYVFVTRTDNSAVMYLWNFYRAADDLLIIADGFINL